MRPVLLFAPLTLFAIVAILVASGLLRPADRTHVSRLVGQPMSALSLAPAIDGKPGLAPGETGVRLVNIFASWCAPCRIEAPQLLALQERGIAIDGIAVRDTVPELRRFLAETGDPYARIGLDPASSAQLALGSAGVPETFVVDARGIIRHQHVGPVMPQDVDALLAAIEAAR